MARRGGGWERGVGAREGHTAQVGHCEEGEEQLGVVLAEGLPALRMPALPLPALPIRGREARQLDHVQHVVLGRVRVRARVRLRLRVGVAAIVLGVPALPTCVG